MIDGKDGYLYALRGNVTADEFGALATFKIDGTEYHLKNFNLPKLVNYDPLTVTPDGIFGVSRGTGSIKGFIFKINTQTMTLQKTFSFTDDSQGIRPFGKLVEGRDGKFYGTTRIGGATNQGVVFRINKDGSQYTKLYDFRTETGVNPETALIQDPNGTLYGVTTKGGKKGRGVLFSITETGQYTKIFDFYDKGFEYVRDDLYFGDDGFIYAEVLHSK